MKTDKERFELIQRALDEARRMHPKFADLMTDKMPRDAADELGKYRKLNSMEFSVADNIINEELMEALFEYLVGNRKNCLIELAHTAVTVVRAMEFVEKEIEKGGGK